MKADGLSERGLRLHGAKSEQRPQPPCATSALPLGRVRDPPGWGPGFGRSEEASSLAGGEAEILGENQVTPRPLRGLLSPEASRQRGKGNQKGLRERSVPGQRRWAATRNYARSRSAGSREPGEALVLLAGEEEGAPGTGGPS